METKICPKCREEKPLEEFYRDKSKKDGRHSYCKICSSQTNKLWYQENLEEVKNRAKDWKYKNKEKAKIHKKESYLRNFENNKHKYRERNKLNYQKNHDKILKENQKRTIDLADRYIKESLIQSGWDKTKLNPDVIEEKRNIIKVKRIIKQLNYCENKEMQ